MKKKVKKQIWKAILKRTARNEKNSDYAASNLMTAYRTIFEQKTTSDCQKKGKSKPRKEP